MTHAGDLTPLVEHAGIRTPGLDLRATDDGSSPIPLSYTVSCETAP